MADRVKALTTVMDELNEREDEIKTFLPRDLPADRFLATVEQALRFNPSILDCKPSSIVTACMKAAYDGLRIDAREAALVAHDMTVKGGPNQGATVKMAQYFPMAFGLIQQIYRGGEVVAIETDCIYEKDEYHVQRGTNPGIHHVPSVQPNRGCIVAAYSVATLKTGHKTFEFLTGGELAQIKAAAKTQMIWKKWEGEMSRKSAIRRHRKTLPLGDRDIVDAEESEEFPEMAKPHKALPSAEAPAKPRPTRHAIEDMAGTESGVVIDQEPETEKIEVGKADKQAANTKQAKNKPEQDDVAIPADGEEWAGWRSDVLSKIEGAKDLTALDDFEAREIQPVIQHAAKALQTEIATALSERRTDLVLDGDDK